MPWPSVRRTPGPLFSTATFIGYVVGGPLGAVAATVGVFLPAFLAVAVSIPILGRLRSRCVPGRSSTASTSAAVGLLGVVAVQLAIGGVRDIVGAATLLATFALLLRGIGTGWLIAGGGRHRGQSLAAGSGLISPAAGLEEEGHRVPLVGLLGVELVRLQHAHREAELGATGGPTPCPDAAAHRRRQAGADEQPDPRSCRHPGTGGIAIEQLEDPAIDAGPWPGPSPGSPPRCRAVERR